MIRISIISSDSTVDSDYAAFAEDSLSQRGTRHDRGHPAVYEFPLGVEQKR